MLYFDKQIGAKLQQYASSDTSTLERRLFWCSIDEHSEFDGANLTNVDLKFSSFVQLSGTIQPARTEQTVITDTLVSDSIVILTNQS